MNRMRELGGNCSQIADRGEQAMNDGKVFMFDGPRTNLEGHSSVGDAHINKGEVHISRLGFDGSINTEFQKAQIFRHEVKHLLGWDHNQMQQPGYQCDP